MFDKEKEEEEFYGMDDIIKDTAKITAKEGIGAGKKVFDLGRSRRRRDKAKKKYKKEKRKRKKAEEGDLIGAIFDV